MIICQVLAELFHADGWMDGRTDRHPDRHDEFISFRSLANKLKNVHNKDTRTLNILTPT